MSIALPVYATIALGAGPWLFARAFRDFRTCWLIENTPTARIRSMAMGLVEIDGQIVQRSEHLAPFSGRPCAYWQVDIASRARRNTWTIVHRNASGSPFFVRDETGLAIIYPHGADCRVRHQSEETCAGIALPDCYAQYMDEHKLAFRHVWKLSVLRFRERILEEGQCVYVLGSAVPGPRVVEVSHDVELQDTGTDGLHQRHIRQLQEQVVGTVRQGENERVFIISQESERELKLTLGLRAWAEMIAGPALTVFGLGYWLHFLASRGRFLG